MKLRLVTTFQKAPILPIQPQLSHLKLKMIQLRVKLNPLLRRPAMTRKKKLKKTMHLPLMTTMMILMMTVSTRTTRMMRMTKMTRTMKMTRMTKMMKTMVMMKMMVMTNMMVMMKMMGRTKMMAMMKMMATMKMMVMMSNCRLIIYNQ